MSGYPATGFSPDTAACEECGRCLARCRYLSLSPAEAAAEIRRINRGQPSRVVDQCRGCYACEAFCEKGLSPYLRILSAWEKRHEARGLPARTRYLLPLSRPNFRQDLPYSEAERALHARWAADRPPAETVLYPGCNLLALPLLATGKMFDELPVWGKWELCCGEMYFRMGLFSQVRRVGERLAAYYRERPVRKMVFACPAGFNMFSRVYPEKFGIRFPFEMEPFSRWVLSALDEGRLAVARPLSLTVALHDSCHARILGSGFMEEQRALLSRLGADVLETPFNRADGLCCGMAAGANTQSGAWMLAATLKRVDELSATGAQAIAAYCAGCLHTFLTIRPLRPGLPPVVHTLELIRRALGEDVETGSSRRARDLALGVAKKAVPRYLDPRRFRLSRPREVKG